jgi:hypothetical protein
MTWGGIQAVVLCADKGRVSPQEPNKGRLAQKDKETRIR